MTRVFPLFISADRKGMGHKFFENHLAKFFIIILLLPYAIFAGEDDQRNDPKGLYLYPHEAIRLEELRILDSETRLKLDEDTGIAAPWEEPTAATTEVPTQDPVDPEEQPLPDTGPKDIDTQIKEAEGLLKRYYSQFLSEKRIWEDKYRGSKFSTKNEQNEVRLLINELIKDDTETNLIRDSEIVFALHKRLGRLYEERENPTQAIRHYQASLRYRNLSQSEEYFLNEKTWNEVRDEESLPARENHKNALLTYRNQEEALENEKKQIHRLGSEYAQGRINSKEYLEAKKLNEIRIVNETERLAIAKGNYENSLIENYEPFRKAKSREDAEVFYNLANLIKKSEETNKERLKIINKSSFAGRGIFVLFDYKRNTGFAAYEYLLEKAYRLDPTFPQPIREIADQLKLDGKIHKSIDFYNKYIEYINEEYKDAIPEEERESIADVYLNLAILNSDAKRKILAAQNYDLFLDTTNDEEKKKKIYYELGRFYEKQIGNLDRSREYYLRWLEGNPEGATEKEVIARYGISLKEKQDRRRDREESSLLLAYEKYREIRTELAEKEKEIVESEREINRYKRELLLTTNDEALAQFRLIQMNLEDQEMERDQIKTRFTSIPTSRIILRLAELRELSRDFSKAKEYYRELIDIGNEQEVSFAVKSLKRVEMTEADGILRERGKLY